MKLSGLVDSRRERAVAAEAGGGGLRLYFHDGDRFRIEELPFRPFVLLSSLEQLTVPCEVAELAGDAPLKFLAEFSGEAEYAASLKELRASKRPFLCWRDAVRQALARCRVRLFAGMEFSELRRMAVALATDAEGRITFIEAADGAETRRWSAADAAEEARLLAEFFAFVAERDPDTVEGFGLYSVVCPALEKACKRHKIGFALGRAGEAAKRSAGSFTLPEGVVRCDVYRAPGRHLVDLGILTRLYDSRTRALESCEREDAERHFGLTGESAAERLLALSAILGPAYFYQTQVLPANYQDLPMRGNGGNLDSLFCAEYLTEGHSLPLPDAPEDFQGALTKSELQGVFHQVRHVDVRSLYPSILLAEQAAPYKDSLKVFPRLLCELRRFRLAAKDAARTAETPDARRDAGALQSAFKILINSFYGYLGFPQGSFNDYRLAAHVTRRGREILGAMLDKLASLGATVIEADTDGVYFQMPEAGGDGFDAALRSVLPPGIEVEFDAEYPAMFSYKSKNYALLKSDGKVALTGAALKSRALEPFQREFIMTVVTSLLAGEPERIAERYAELRRQIAEHLLPLEKFAKTEVLNDSPESYRKKLASGSGRHSAAYDLVLASPRTYRAGDRVRFYVTGTQKKPKLSGSTRLLEDAGAERDENTVYYLDKLDALYQNYRPFIASTGQN